MPEKIKRVSKKVVRRNGSGETVREERERERGKKNLKDREREKLKRVKMVMHVAHCPFPVPS